MAKLKVEKGESYVKALLTLLIIDTADFLSVGKSMSNNQVMQTVNLILEDYWHYKIDHFVLCFNRAKKGYFGKQYDRIDGQVIFSWLEQFDLEFSADVETERRNEAKRIEKDILSNQKGVPMPENVKALITDLGKKETVFKQIEISEEQKYFNGLINDFNNLHELQGDEPGKKFVKYDGKMLDVNEYIEARVNQPKETK